MKINLRDINEENWLECIGLTTDKWNQHFVFEEFIPSNTLSLAQSKIENDGLQKEYMMKIVLLDLLCMDIAMRIIFMSYVRLLFPFINIKEEGSYGKEAIKIIIGRNEKKLEGGKGNIFYHFIQKK